MHSSAVRYSKPAIVIAILLSVSNVYGHEPDSSGTFSGGDCDGAPRGCEGASKIADLTGPGACSVAHATLLEPDRALRERRGNNMSSANTVVVNMLEAPGACTRTQISKLGWQTSAIWSGQDSLVAIDRYWGRVVPISVSGNGANKDPVYEHMRDHEAHLSEARRHRSGAILIEDDESDVIYSNDAAGVFKPWLRIEGEKYGKAKLVEVYDWQPTADGIVAFSDMKTDDGKGLTKWHAALAYFGRNGRHQIFREYEIDEAVNYIYVRNLDYIAITESEGVYILSFDETKPVVLVADIERDGIARKLPMPTDFRQGIRPAHRSAGNAATAFDVYQQIEKTRMVTGIYALGNRLFLLGKSSADGYEGKTTWEMIEIDSESGAELARVELPTLMPHISALPGADHWAFIERNRVEKIGDLPTVEMLYIRTESAFVMPDSWIDVGISRTLPQCLGAGKANATSPISRSSASAR